jgi:hypothetical protein
MKSVQPGDRWLNLPNNCEIIADYAGGGIPPNRTITTTSGTQVLSEVGVSIVPQAATDNAIGSSLSNAKHWLPAAGQSILFTARLKFAEANTDDANIYVGLTSSTAANTIGNDGAGPAASYSGFGFFKVDGGLNWNVEASNGGTQLTTELTANNSLSDVAHVAGSASWQTLEIDVKMKTSTKCDVMFRINGVTVVKLTDYVWTGMVAMGEAVAIKNGSTTGETLVLAYDATCKNRVTA